MNQQINIGIEESARNQIAASLSSIGEASGGLIAEDMVQDLVVANETRVRTLREVLPVASAADDESTASLLADRMVVHEKTAWMLRSAL